MRRIPLHRLIGFGVVVTVAVWFAINHANPGSPLHTPAYYLLAACGVALMLIP